MKKLENHNTLLEAENKMLKAELQRWKELNIQTRCQCLALRPLQLPP